MVQIGARNMQNFQLLKAVGKMQPVLLKRPLQLSSKKWMLSAGTSWPAATGGLSSERGIRTFEVPATPSTSPLCLSSTKTHLPVITLDPSHATGKPNLVEPMMIAAVAASADDAPGEVHYDPRHAWSDGAQCP